MAGNTGVMIGLFLPTEIANQVALSGGELASDLHITLAYLGDSTTLDPNLRDKLSNLLQRFATDNCPIEGVISGSGLFTADDDGTSPLYLSYDSLNIQQLRSQLVSMLGFSNINVQTNHGFTPHITLKYLGKNETVMPIKVNPIFIKFGELTLCWADERTTYNFLGNKVMVMDNYSNPIDVSNEAEQTKKVTTFASPSLLQNAMKIIGDLGSFVMKRGKVFEVGDYPDKKFTITAEEMQEIIKDFQSVPLDYEHTSGWLDDRLGYLTNLAMKPGNNKDVFGAIALPHNINELFRDMPIKLSLTFETRDGKKKVTRAALTANPRVADAVLMSQFSNDVAEVVKAKETTKELAQIAEYVANPVEFLGNRHNVTDKQALWTSHDIIAELIDADCSPSKRDDMSKPVYLGTEHNNELNNQDNNNNEENTSMSQEIKDTDKTVETTKFAEMAARMEQQEREIARLTRERNHDKAVNAANDVISTNPVVFSAHKEALTALLEQLAIDDSGNTKPEVITNFSNTTKEVTFAGLVDSRLDLVATFLTQVVPNKSYMTQDMLATAQAQGKDPLANFSLNVLANRTTTPTVEQSQVSNQSLSAEKRKSLLGLVGITPSPKVK